MIKYICTSKLIVSVILLVALASPSFAAEAEMTNLERFELFTSSPVFTQLFFFLPEDQIWGLVEDADAVNSEYRTLTRRLKPVGTLAIFQNMRTKVKKSGLPNILTLKQIDTQAMIDWELAVTRDLKEVAVAVNFRF
jgi:hypothetical protein